MKYFCLSLLLVTVFINLVLIVCIFIEPDRVELYPLNIQYSFLSGYCVYLYLKDFVYNKD